MTSNTIVSSGDVIRLNSTFNPLGIRKPADSLYEVGLLTSSGIEHFLDLQAIAQLEAMATGNSHHLKPRSESDLDAHIRLNMGVIAVRNILTGEHVAQALITNPFQKAAKNMEGYPLQYKDRAIQSFFIHPDHRFSVLSSRVRDTAFPAQMIFDAANMLATADNAERLVAKISKDNVNSIRSFERHGFTLDLGTDADPVKGHPVQFVGASLLPSLPVHMHPQGDKMQPSCP
jgi:hypothetical protein